MQSVATRAPIVATVITLLIVPIVNEDGERVGTREKRGSVHTLRCVPGTPIKATPLAKRLGLVGKACRRKITRRVAVKPVKGARVVKGARSG
jgi:hypothetical protein